MWHTQWWLCFYHGVCIWLHLYHMWFLSFWCCAMWIYTSAISRCQRSWDLTNIINLVNLAGLKREPYYWWWKITFKAIFSFSNSCMKAYCINRSRWIWFKFSLPTFSSIRMHLLHQILHSWPIFRMPLGTWISVGSYRPALLHRIPN